MVFKTYSIESRDVFGLAFVILSIFSPQSVAEGDFFRYIVFPKDAFSHFYPYSTTSKPAFSCLLLSH